MEPYTLEHDIEVFYVTASSFPEGIPAAFDQLGTLLPNMEGRQLYGISRPENGGHIVYRAAVNALSPGEGQQYGCDTFIIRKGKYLSALLHDYTKDPARIGQAFDELLHAPQLDPQGYCLEQYLDNTHLRCMVPLTN
ncbi:transcriptional regulator [Chitinophaga eiseniae]|uniref:Transcriptional regulator n=1 Tax=Chitinophaga eiseniae TaxID=634771 RepID=A0A847SNV4_9BACT|nr:transcriptional regulator [Chitinophaga eiseniae]NLR80577.1 transcriptional regulator [Chitinophaga eiseniae]